MNINVDAIPQEMIALDQWVVWRYETRKGKITKPPYQPRAPQYGAKSNDPSTWATFAEAMKVASTGDFDGPGFMFNNDLFGADLDNAFDNGTLKPWAQAIVDACPTYCEVSPSGNGLHIISKGRLPDGWTGKNREYEDGKLEIYSRGRFFTVTGNRIPTAPATIEDQSAYILELYARLGGANGNGNGNGSKHASKRAAPEPFHDSIEDRLEVALRDPVFSRLWYGDTSGNGDDDSRADLALCNKLAFYFGRDFDTIDRMFRQSKLYREKWERADYRPDTINLAIEGTTETYTPPKRGDAAGRTTPRSEPINQPREENSEAGLDSAPVLPNLSNALKILETDLRFKGRVWFDEFLNRMMTGKPPREWNDADDILLTVEIQRKLGLPKMALETVSKAIIAVSRKNVRNCVKDYLNALQWDRIPRIGDFFSDHFGADVNAYTSSVGRNFWISMVARVLRPGCKVDNMVILEGSQGLKKSMALEAIGGPYYAEQHENVSGAREIKDLAVFNGPPPYPV